MSLRSKVLSGGVYLVIRQGIGMMISLGGILLLTRTIGPEQYGLYTAAYGLFYYLYSVCQFGIVVYVVRQDGNDRAVDHQAFTLLLIISCLGLGIGTLMTPLIANWVRLEGFSPVFLALLVSLPASLLLQIPLAQMERALDYQRVAWIELIGQLAFFTVAIFIAFQGGGAWGPVVGWWIQQLNMLVLFFGATKYRPRLCWHSDLVKKMIEYSLGYSAALWVWGLRVLVNPLIVGRWLGAEAVAYIALANRMIEVLGFVKTVTFRLSISTLSRLQDNRERLTQAITEGMALQVLALGPLLVIVGWLGPWLIPLLFGQKWIPAMTIYPFIAVSLLVNTGFTLHSSTLFVLHRNWAVFVFNSIHIALLIGAALFLVPRFGLIGYGYAELATFPSYLVIHAYLVRYLKAPDYWFAGLLITAFGLALFPYQLGWWVVLGLVVVGLLPTTQQRLMDFWKSLKQARSES